MFYYHFWYFYTEKSSLCYLLVFLFQHFNVFRVSRCSLMWFSCLSNRPILKSNKYLRSFLQLLVFLHNLLLNIHMTHFTIQNVTYLNLTIQNVTFLNLTKQNAIFCHFLNLSIKECHFLPFF